MNEKIKVCNGLVEKYKNTSYDIDAVFDAQIILSCQIDALSAKMWPGQENNKKRFTQLLIEFTPEKFVITLIL